MHASFDISLLADVSSVVDARVQPLAEYGAGAAAEVPPPEAAQDVGEADVVAVAVVRMRVVAKITPGASEITSFIVGQQCCHHSCIRDPSPVPEMCSPRPVDPWDLTTTPMGFCPKVTVR